MLKVVVIDSNAISRDLLATLLISGNYQVAGVANASSAGLASMVKLQPHIVCIDIGTPDSDGWSRLESIGNSLPKALVFMMSSQFDASTIEQAVQRGVQGFIVKPFKQATVLATIHAAVMKIARQHTARHAAARTK